MANSPITSSGKCVCSHEVVGEDGANQERDGAWFAHLTASSSIAFSDYEPEIDILEQKRVSVTGMCIGVFKDVLSHERWIAVKVG
jgi:hypothetical protein